MLNISLHLHSAIEAKVLPKGLLFMLKCGLRRDFGA